MELVLASGSPRRRELLAQLGVAFRVVVPVVDETPSVGEPPRALVARLAAAKAAAIDAPLVLAADTVVDVDGAVFGKPVDGFDARRMLTALAGRVHEVHTGVALRREGAETVVEVVTTAVRFAPLTAVQIDRYVATGEPEDKAGAYAMQGRAGAFIIAIAGSPSNVIGLPLATVARLLAVVPDGDLTVDVSAGG
ncbi:MAG: Maf family protein [Desertimonas sp.]